jgi:aminopeptidase N
MHEMMHSWYQGMLGTNELEYAWMDEGFTQYAGARVYASLGNTKGFAQEPSYVEYYKLTKSGLEEPLTTHSDHFNSNFASADAAYYKGVVFIEQLGYIVGAAVRDKILLEYYKQWRFKHPNSSDFIKLSEEVSGIKLNWYKMYWCNTVKTIDYSIDSLWEEGGVSKIRLLRNGKMPMPIDVQLTFRDGSTEMHYIPLNLMYGAKATENSGEQRIEHEEWRWTHPTYVVEFKRRLTDLKRAEIDPTKRMADVDQRNNVLQLNW